MLPRVRSGRSERHTSGESGSHGVTAGWRLKSGSEPGHTPMVGEPIGIFAALARAECFLRMNRDLDMGKRYG
jgi:hypothetical protein